MSATTSTHETITRAVNLRVRDDIRDLIDQAARSQGKSRSEFMIDAARRAAEDALLDQTLVRVDQKTYKHFLNVLDKPPGGEGYNRLMKVKKPWKA
ncbi:MAG: type II toxin-antitoxin system TacA family antitoxin [Thiobacillus sp.]